jgi:hypothetical protein
MTTPKIIWILGILEIILSAIRLLYLPSLIETGAVLHPLIFVIDSLVGILCSIGIIKRYALAAVIYSLWKIALLVLLIIDPMWLIGIPLTFRKLLVSNLLPFIFIFVTLFYWRRLIGWPISNKQK